MYINNQVNAIDSTWGSLADLTYFSVSYGTCEELWKKNDGFHSESTTKKFLCLNMTNTDTYEHGEKRNIWEKSWRSWVYLGENHLEDYDFFMKTDSDSFVVIDNMKTYLSYFDPEKEWYLGHTLMHEWQDDVLFNTGIGYVLSRGSLRKLTPKLKTMGKDCKGHFRGCCDVPGPNEDAHMGVCLGELGIVPANTLDKEVHN